jgi:serine/threonine-protein kinase RsbW
VLTDGATLLAATWFPGEAEAVGQAREFITAALGPHWPRLDDAQLMLSEIASNTVRHTASGDRSGWFDVVVSKSGDTVRVAVADRGGSSEPRMADDGGELGAGVLTGGRGLRIVDALADGWGHHGDELGRVVWFEITGKHEDLTAPVTFRMRL